MQNLITAFHKNPYFQHPYCMYRYNTKTICKICGLSILIFLISYIVLAVLRGLFDAEILSHLIQDNVIFIY